jgi:hypothetical protein
MTGQLKNVKSPSSPKGFRNKLRLTEPKKALEQAGAKTFGPSLRNA